MVHKRSKPSIFLDDILSVPKLVREDVEQLRQKRLRRRHRGGYRPGDGGAADSDGSDSAISRSRSPPPAGRQRVYSRIGEWAASYRPPVFAPLQLERVGDRVATRRCPQRYLFSDVWGIPGGPHAATTFGNVMHTTIKQFMAALRKGQRLTFEEVAMIFRREWTSAGFEDSYQEECLPA